MTDRLTDRRTDGRDEQHRQADKETDGRTDGQTDRQTDRRMDERTDRRTYSQSDQILRQQVLLTRFLLSAGIPKCISTIRFTNLCDGCHTISN